MRYHEIAHPSACQHLITVLQKSATARGLKTGFVDNTRRAATPYVIDCPDLSRERLGEQEFKKQFSARRDWCRKQCPYDHEIEPIDDEALYSAGRRFRFANQGDAALFKMNFV